VKLRVEAVYSDVLILEQGVIYTLRRVVSISVKYVLFLVTVIIKLVNDVM